MSLLIIMVTVMRKKTLLPNIKHMTDNGGQVVPQRLSRVLLEGEREEWIMDGNKKFPLE